MMRTAEDYLREEYSALLPRLRQTAAELETQIRHLLLPVMVPSLTMLNDLAGVRILAFPKCRVLQIDEALRSHFPFGLPIRYPHYRGPRTHSRSSITEIWITSPMYAPKFN